MEIFIENILVYSMVALLIIITFYFYLRSYKKQSKTTLGKIEKAKEYGFNEPVSLHPVINEDICIGSSACVSDCPEQDILGLVSGTVKTINASHCVGHGACFHACPVEAITLVIGTEQRGVELPHVSQTYETNISGIYIAGELGGMGLIKNAVEQGKKAMTNIITNLPNKRKARYDVIIIGAGPSGISATLTAAKNKKKFLTVEQDSLGGTVFSFPRAKVVMTSPVELPLHGNIKLRETSKSELISLWTEVLDKNNISINENEKVLEITKTEDYFEVKTNQDEYTCSKVLLAIGRRGSPRKLGVPGENKEKVYYRLLEPELIKKQNVLVVGGGDSAIETALLLAENGSNQVILSYRSESFKRAKPKNLEKINKAKGDNAINVIYNSTIKNIEDSSVELEINKEQVITLDNDLVYVFAGGELPNKFLEKIGVKISKKFGETILKH
ncbi:MAG: NAD(P)-binding domain-containing protein [Ignavibacteriae bacterium]|nr:NAD(P)-binding domain-containing protein [Ignavibacteriota bacterium]